MMSAPQSVGPKSKCVITPVIKTNRDSEYPPEDDRVTTRTVVSVRVVSCHDPLRRVFCEQGGASFLCLGSLGSVCFSFFLFAWGLDGLKVRVGGRWCVG